MHPPFFPRYDGDLKRLVEAYPLAWVISRQFNASPLPLLAEYGDGGEIISLLGHCARRNPLVADFTADAHGLALFNGPNGYISPDYVSRKNWGPTWNYAVIRFELEIEFVEEETGSAIEKLLQHMALAGAEPWSVAALGERYEPMLRQIIAFRGHVRKTTPSFKLGQDEDAGTLADIIANHPDADLTGWMAAQADDIDHGR